jgi:hypothetical protein
MDKIRGLDVAAHPGTIVERIISGKRREQVRPRFVILGFFSIPYTKVAALARFSETMQ